MSGWGLVLGLLASSAAEPMMQSRGRLRGFEEPFRGGGGSSGGGSSSQDSGGSRRDRSSDDYDDSSSSSSYQDDYWGSRSTSRGGGGGTSFGDAGPLWLLFYPFLDHRLRYEDYPYAWDPLEDEGRLGVYYLSDTMSTKEWSLELRPYSLRIDKDLFALGLSGTARNGSGGNFRFDVAQYREDIGDRTDRLMLHKYEYNFGPGRGPRNFHWTFGFGLGILDGVETHPGFEIQAAGEWYPFEPLSVRAGAAWIFFEEAGLGDFEAEARIHINRFAFGVGVRSIVNSDGDDLTGPMVSLAVWF